MSEFRKRSILILSPEFDQARALATWLKRMGAGSHIVGGTLLGDKNAFYPERLFDSIISIHDVSDLKEYHTVVPTGSHCTSWMASNWGDFKIGDVSFSKENLRVYDKPWLYDFAATIDIPVPETWTEFEVIPDSRRPIFYKPKREGHGGPRRLSKKRDTVPSYARSRDYLFQEYIPGREVYGYGFIARNGKVLTACQHIEVASMPRDGGSAVAVQSVNNIRLEEISRKLLKALNYEGWGLIEFKHCPRRDDFVLMELNAKFWASLEFALRSQPVFGHLLFGIDGKRENLQGLFWPDHYMCAIRGNFLIGFRAAIRLPWAQSKRRSTCRQVLSGILPAPWIDYYREKYVFQRTQVK